MGSYKGVGPTSRLVILGSVVNGAAADDPALPDPTKILILERLP
jgi:hypothetical protein